MKFLFCLALLLLQELNGLGQEISARDYQVYCDIIRQEFPVVPKSIVVFQELASSREAEAIALAIKNKDFNTLSLLSEESEFDSASLNTILLFKSDLLPSTSFTSAFPLAASTLFIERHTFEKLFKHNVVKGWSKFYKRFPSAEGVFEFSRIRYSDVGNLAVVYSAVRGGSFSGHGHLLVLEQSGNGWRVKHRFKIWDN